MTDTTSGTPTTITSGLATMRKSATSLSCGASSSIFCLSACRMSSIMRRSTCWTSILPLGQTYGDVPSDETEEGEWERDLREEEEAKGEDEFEHMPRNARERGMGGRLAELEGRDRHRRGARDRRR